MVDPQADTTDLEGGAEFANKFFTSSAAPLACCFGAATHPGKVRSMNEDHYAVVRRRRSTELLLTDLPPETLPLADDSAFAMVVADGMGGTRFGEFASRLALQTMFELAQQATSWVTRFTDLDAQQIRQRVDAYVQRVQSTLQDYIAADPKLAGMGTTWTSAHLLPPHALIVHIGDSRAYHWRQGELRQLTHDETMAQAFVDAGLSKESVKQFGHVLINALGGDSDRVAAQLHHLELSAGDQLLLCTDGLTDMVDEQEIARVLRQATTPQLACDALVDTALKHGGKDNITVVLAAMFDA